MRQELGLPACGPLCPWQLAAHLGFLVVPLSHYKAAVPWAVAHFQSRLGQREFSAITSPRGYVPLIIHNDSHPKDRQASNIAHELAHALLLHPPMPAVDTNGFRQYNATFEEEANWLGPALLVSDEAAVWAVRQELTVAAAAIIYGVSKQVMQMRINVSGARKRAA